MNHRDDPHIRILNLMKLAMCDHQDQIDNVDKKMNMQIIVLVLIMANICCEIKTNTVAIKTVANHSHHFIV